MNDLELVTGPAWSGKTAALLERFRTAVGDDPASGLWLAPTGRRAAQVRPLLPPGAQVHTFASLADELLQGERGSLVPAAQRRLLLEEVVAELRARNEVRYFDRVHETRGFAEELLGLFDEFQREGITPANFARRAYRAQLEGQPARTINGLSIRPRDRECARFLARYRVALDRQHLHDEHREARASRAILDGAPLALRLVCVDGFSDFTSGQHALLAALRHAAPLCLSLPDEAGDARLELFSGPRRTAGWLAPTRTETLPRSERPGRPRGLAHLERQLFQPLRKVVRGGDAAGITRIEAPGVTGEARMAARRLRLLLRGGASPGRIVVAARDLTNYADLLREVFAEYELPFEVEGTRPLARSGPVALLVKAVRLSEDDWPFAAVTALLRHSCFRPAWPEAAGEIPALTEVLLRLLGEPRGRDAYVAAAARWAESVQPGLEDEQAEESRRRKTHDLARRCLPFLRRLLAAWDGAPARAPLAAHLRWLRHFSQELGLEGGALDADERAALGEFWKQVEGWQRRRADAGGPLDRRTFLRRLATLAGDATMPLTRPQAPPGAGGEPAGPAEVIRVLPAPAARDLEMDHLILLGLGERGFPRPERGSGLLDEADRVALGLPGAGAAMADEMLLFYRLVAAPRVGLTLCFPAVDERGQEMLPGAFLQAALDCFDDGAVPVERKQMLVDGLDTETPLSAAEARIRVAAGASQGLPGLGALPAHTAGLLADAAELFRWRFREADFSTHEGVFTDPALIERLGRSFGPERIFSPTALEEYVACPFRFYLGHVLRLEPLEEPSEEIHVTRRGMAFHRGLARLHQDLKFRAIHEPTDEVHRRAMAEIMDAVAEDVERAPSPATKALWRLEGHRLLKLAARYRGHWVKFLTPWRKRSVAPRPHFFEVDFGLPAPDPLPDGYVAHPPLVLRSGDMEVRVSGRIDRVDVAEIEDGLGFWIIDYKTGRGSHYTGADLAEFRKLQLTLYAHAVETVLLAGLEARPLGMAYWLVGEGGPKIALPGRTATTWLDESGRWQSVRRTLVDWVTTLVQHIRAGAFPLAPRSEHCTATCAYGKICRITQARGVGKVFPLGLPGEQAAAPSPEEQS